MASQRGDYYQGLFLGKGGNLGERIIVNFRFPEKNTTVNATWWFEDTISSRDYFFKNFFGTELKDIIITRNGIIVSKTKSLREMFPLEFELTFEVKLAPKPKVLKRTVHFSRSAILISKRAHLMHRVKLHKKHHKIWINIQFS